MSSSWLQGVTEPRRMSGWIDYDDSQYTEASPLALPAGVETEVVIDGLGAFTERTYRGDVSYEPYDNGVLKGQIPGESLLLRLGFTVKTTEDIFPEIAGLITSLTTSTLKLALQRENTIRMKLDFTFFATSTDVTAPRALNATQNVTELFVLHSGPAVINPGGVIKLTSTYDAEVYDFDLMVQRVHAP